MAAVTDFDIAQTRKPRIAFTTNIAWLVERQRRFRVHTARQTEQEHAMPDTHGPECRAGRSRHDEAWKAGATPCATPFSTTACRRNP